LAPKLQSLKVSKKAAQRLLYEKAARKTLMKLTTVFNFINILQAAFALIFFAKKQKCKYRKAVQNIFVQKSQA